MFGIPDLGVAVAYLLCILSTLVCVGYAWRHWNRGEETVEPDDVKWVAAEKQAEEKV